MGDVEEIFLTLLIPLIPAKKKIGQSAKGKGQKSK